MSEKLAGVRSHRELWVECPPWDLSRGLHLLFLLKFPMPLTDELTTAKFTQKVRGGVGMKPWWPDRQFRPTLPRRGKSESGLRSRWPRISSAGALPEPWALGASWQRRRPSS